MAKGSWLMAASRLLEKLRSEAMDKEASDRDYTILRPSRLNNNDEVDHKTTAKNESFKGAKKAVFGKSLADLGCG